jgi:hypothetical protein
LERGSEAEAELRKKVFKDGFFLPSYDGFGISNLPSTVASLLDAGTIALPTLNGDIVDIGSKYSSVVVILVDALGWKLVKKCRNESRQLEALVDMFQPKPITTAFPSTTSTVLTTLNTGYSPAEHGVVGYSMYIKELGFVGNMLDFKIINAPRDESIFEKGILPADFLGLPTVYQTLAQRGVESYVLTRNYIMNSGLSRMTHAGAGSLGYVDVGDMFVILRKLLERNEGLPRYVFVYWPSVDTASHTFGPWGEETAAEVRSFFFSLQEELLSKLSKRAKEGCSLLITADHGHSQIEEGGVFDASTDSKLMDMLMIPPTGDSRASFLHVKKGVEEDVRRYLSTKFGSSFYVTDIQEAVKKGLFGRATLRKGLLERLGDLLVLPEQGKAIFYPFRHERDYTQRGAHAGLTEDELFVPLFWVPLEDVPKEGVRSPQVS